MEGSRVAMDDEQVEELREAFATFDRDGNGTIGYREFVALLDVLDADMTAEEARIGFHELDQDRSGAIGFDEFVAWWGDR